MKIYDVAIIGSGPSGASAAYELAKDGISTVIIEKETLPRYKTCGGGLVYRGRKNMPFDISSVVEKEFNEIALYFQPKNIKFCTKRDVPIISMVMREEFDYLIVNKAKELGVPVLENHKVTKINFGELQTIHTTAETIQAKFIIAADGALSPVAKMAGWEESRHIIPALEYEIKVPEADFERLSREVRFDIDVVPFGYGWCFPKKNHLSVGVCCLKKTKIDLKEYYQNYLKILGINEMLSESAHGFVIPISSRKGGFVSKNVFLTGDAAGFADPLVAEGISNAILSGTLAAKAIVESKLDADIAAKLYQEKLEERLLSEIQIGVHLSKFFYGNKIIRNFFIKKNGQKVTEALTELFCGNRTYPTNYKEVIRNLIKVSI